MDSNMSPESNTPPPFNPSVNRPPPIIPSMPAPRPVRSGAGWKIFAVVLLILLAMSFVMNLRHLVKGITGGGMPASRDGYGPQLKEVTVKDSESTNKIVVVPIEGIITGSAVDHSDYSMVTVIKEE